MTTQQNNSAAKHIVGIYTSILQEMFERSSLDHFGVVDGAAARQVAALLTIASVFDQQGDTHKESLDGIIQSVDGVVEAVGCLAGEEIPPSRR